MAVTLTLDTFEPVPPHGILAPSRVTDGEAVLTPGAGEIARAMAYYETVMPRGDLLQLAVRLVSDYLGENYETAPEEVCNAAANMIAQAVWGGAGRGDWRRLMHRCGAAHMLSTYRAARVSV